MRQIMSRPELLALRTGVIVTLYGGWTGEKGSKLHRTGCRHIRRMTAPPEKWWGPTLGAVRAWLAGNNLRLDPDRPYCRTCMGNEEA